ncbi:MAG: class I SAM-dependent methyltransferase [Bryobacteraceae bacterium]
MHEILSTLAPGSCVLDLGSGSGSFNAEKYALTVTGADLEAPPKRYANFVICRASQLPFRSRSFQALVLNHSLEHFDNLAESVHEIARVLAERGFLYIAVPDASTFTDRVYRWLARGGGHVNQFCDASNISRMVAASTGLKHAGTRVLCTSLSFLNRRNAVSRPPGKLLLFCNGHEGFLRVLTFVLRLLDRRFRWRTSMYGWAFYFGDLDALDLTAWSNVCVRCGSGHPSSSLKNSGRMIGRRFLPDVYFCPQCNARNFFTEDEYFGYLH